MLSIQPRRRDGQDGGSSVEYGLLVAGVAGVVAAAVFLFGGAVKDLFNTTCVEVSTAGAAHGSSISC
jgi:pilus assembly protein Flp/PilA